MEGKPPKSASCTFTTPSTCYSAKFSHNDYSNLDFFTLRSDCGFIHQLLYHKKFTSKMPFKRRSFCPKSSLKSPF